MALRYFAERGTWDSTLDTFINSDGDPTQFAVCNTYARQRQKFNS